MPVVFGSFETSLRGQDSPRGDKRVLHKGCSGHLHGHGVKKERASRTPDVKFSKDCCHENHENSSSDEDNKQNLEKRRSQSSEYSRLQHTPLSSRRSTSSNSAVAQRLFSSPTKAVTAKYRKVSKIPWFCEIYNVFKICQNLLGYVKAYKSFPNIQIVIAQEVVS